MADREGQALRFLVLISPLVDKDTTTPYLAWPVLRFGRCYLKNDPTTIVY